MIVDLTRDMFRIDPEERFRGTSRLEAILSGDSTLDITKRRSDRQSVERHGKEWIWDIYPKATGRHALNLLVRGVTDGDDQTPEDYDPEKMTYDVNFNLR